jgi:hypothetical protein
MSKLTNDLREIGIVNTYDFAGKGNVALSYSSATTGLGSRYARWIVVRPGFQTDSGAHWMDNGNKTFSVSCKAVKDEVLEQAKAWAGERYKIAEWAKTPFGDWMSKDFVEARMAALKTQIKANKDAAKPDANA